MNDTAPDWRDRAACTRSTISFFPEGRRYEEQSAAAKAVCRTCPVRVDCLLHAINEGEEWGVWGGLDERERAPLRAGRARLTSVIHHPSDPLDDSDAQLAAIGFHHQQTAI